MSKEQKEEPEEKKGLRMTSVVAAALAAVTAALLGSTLGVAGTVVGAGVASVITTVGGEVYLRSLHRTREAAKKALETAGQRRSRGGLTPVSDPGDAPTMHLSTDPSEMPTVRLSKLQEPEPSGSLGEKLRTMRWPLIIGSSVVAFVVALVVLLGIDWTTKGTVSTGLIPRQPQTSQDREPSHDGGSNNSPQAPESKDAPPDNPATEPTTPPPTTSESTKEQAPPPSSSTSSPSKPSTTSQPSTKAAPPSNGDQ
nr:hypothetical protein [Amycolatopsis jejuensis]